MRPINNVVDVTNYVMFELGQPLHAFDWERIAGGVIVVRRARANERFVTLDGRERILDEGDHDDLRRRAPGRRGGSDGGVWNRRCPSAPRASSWRAPISTPRGWREAVRRLNLPERSFNPLRPRRRSRASGDRARPRRGANRGGVRRARGSRTGRRRSPRPRGSPADRFPPGALRDLDRQTDGGPTKRGGCWRPWAST